MEAETDMFCFSSFGTQIKSHENGVLFLQVSGVLADCLLIFCTVSLLEYWLIVYIVFLQVAVLADCVCCVSACFWSTG